jgi:hypothetical protein
VFVLVHVGVEADGSVETKTLLLLPSTAAQNVGETHETPIRLLEGSMDLLVQVGVDTVGSVVAYASPEESTASQKVVDVHEMAVKATLGAICDWFQVGVAAVGSVDTRRSSPLEIAAHMSATHENP